MLIVIPGVLSREEASEIRARLEAASWQDGAATAGHIAVKAKSNQQLDQNDPLANELGALIVNRLSQNAHFIAAALPLKMLPPRFNRYTGQGAYGRHIDNSIFAVPGSSERVRSDLSATLFLSEPDSYDGGELIAEFGMHNQPVKLPAGHLILYPSSSVHEVTPVTRGMRFAAFFWVQSLVREQTRRTMLLDLDDSIQALTAQSPDNPEIVRLTGLYHNLLREWSAT